MATSVPDENAMITSRKSSAHSRAIDGASFKTAFLDPDRSCRTIIARCSSRAGNPMFDNLTARLSRTIENLRGRGRITEDNIGEAMREVRVALLEADVALPVIKTFIESVKAKALGAEVASSLTPGQAFIGIIHQELVQLMGGPRAGINLRAQPPIVVLLAGLQGAGKTTTAAKLARWLIEREKKRVLLVSTDVRRPAAMLQLERLSEQVGAQYFAASASDPPANIARAAVDAAKRGVFDVLIVDTAGRLHVDERP